MLASEAPDTRQVVCVRMQLEAQELQKRNEYPINSACFSTLKHNFKVQFHHVELRVRDETEPLKNQNRSGALHHWLDPRPVVSSVHSFAQKNKKNSHSAPSWPALEQSTTGCLDDMRTPHRLMAPCHTGTSSPLGWQ